MSSQPLKNQCALVTGGSRGYGAGIAKALVEAGARVYITGRNEETLRRSAAATGAHPLVADVTSAADWERVRAAIEAESAGVDLLINNAGAAVRIADVEAQSPEEIAAVIAVNLTGPILGVRALLPGMKQRGRGTILNLSSICDHQSWPGWTIYGAAKAGLRKFSEGLYTECRPHGVRVTTLTPSWGRTGFQEAANLDGFDAATAAAVTGPEELGAVVVQLCALPGHLTALEMTLLPLVQEIVPY